MDEVKLLPCDDAVVKLARNALRDNVFKTADDNLHRAVESAIYRMHNSEIARQLLRIVAATRPTIVTDEVVERVARAMWEDAELRLMSSPWVMPTKFADNKKSYMALARAAIAAMPAIPPQSLGDHALPPSGLSRDASQAKPAAAIVRRP